MDDPTIASWRLHNLGLAAMSYPSATAVVDGLVGIQAEQYAHAMWAVATRTDGVTAEEFSRQFNDGEILRTHVLRPTWHFVRPDDIRWLVELTAPRINATLTQLQRAHDIDAATLESSTDLIGSILSEKGQLTRAALGERLRDAGFPDERMVVMMMMMFHAEASLVICSGPTEGSTQTYALLEERAPGARRLDRDKAIAELVLRYFMGHGPATERDLAYWATMTLTDVRAGLGAIGDQLDHFDHGGKTYWHGPPPPSPEWPPTPRGHLLIALDEYHNGYQDSRSLLDLEGIVPGRTEKQHRDGSGRRADGGRHATHDPQGRGLLRGQPLSWSRHGRTLRSGEGSRAPGRLPG
ncbi:MAG: hypothetical protein GEU79_17150 [Acidimicrobiia bacterium]|nr:hypothetical protein [Acidimicrobiia bacterium]